MTATCPEPIANPDLVGHDEAERGLLAAWTGRRLHHGWLIAGPRGIGKATLALRFARFVLAGGGQGGGGQGGLFGDIAPAVGSLHMPAEHPVFRRVAARGHGDFRLIERRMDEKKGRRRGEIVVEDVRDIGPFLSLTAAEGGWRVVVVDAADEMNVSAANALLKVLEEPPGRALLLLVCHNPGRILPTIRSRCRTLTLKPLPDGVVADLLGRYRPDLADDERRALVQLAEGSIGRALDLAERGGAGLYRDLITLLAAAPAFDIPALHAFGDKLARGDGEGLVTAGELLQGWLVRLVRQGAGVGPAVEAVPGESALAQRLAAAGLDQWVEVWEKITRLFARADALNLDRKQVILDAAFAVGRRIRP